MIQEEGPLRTRLRKLTYPAPDWGPAEASDRAEWKAATQKHQRAQMPAHMLRTDTAVSTIPMLQVTITISIFGVN